MSLKLYVETYRDKYLRYSLKGLYGYGQVPYPSNIVDTIHFVFDTNVKIQYVCGCGM